MTPEEQAVLECARVGRLATADADGNPHVVPICYALVGTPDKERVVSAIDEKPKSTRDLQRVRDIRTNSSVAVLVDFYDEDWSRLAWVQVRGRARVLSSGASNETDSHETAVCALESKYEQYASDAHDLRDRAILELDVDRTLSWGALEAYE
ncbi:TIGR03668 family PPOX class F420-dependent oxidoreductase [Halobacteria archaeon AArc-m2/3/4]|uniref:TIGR03668 family PPOX class F420-dependent oxidoreductase n=1 Tax=Natronoglomus mannanivorans TaxID=2979990 RepID=A0ABT2QIV3_9EURY|nr:TIGR03668 family PPOX class F420-dependent oxidoreductase [Halobacteria archaeon AArc-m2/3/4]